PCGSRPRSRPARPGTRGGYPSTSRGGLADGGGSDTGDVDGSVRAAEGGRTKRRAGFGRRLDARPRSLPDGPGRDGPARSPPRPPRRGAGATSRRRLASPAVRASPPSVARGPDALLRVAAPKRALVEPSHVLREQHATVRRPVAVHDPAFETVAPPQAFAIGR